MRCPTLSTVCGDPSAIPSCRAFHSDHSSSPRGTLGIMLYNGFFDPSRPYFIRWGNLPHLRQEGGLYFVTFRLNDSIPLKKLQVWDRALKTLRGHNTSREGADRVRLAGEIESLTSQIEVWLDRGWGSCALRFSAARDIVESTLRYFDGTRYELGEFYVAPNHVHVIVRPAGNCDLSDIISSWKRFSTRMLWAVPEVRTATERSGGQLWQYESFDHLIRNDQHYDQFISYIRNHAVG